MGKRNQQRIGKDKMAKIRWKITDSSVIKGRNWTARDILSNERGIGACELSDGGCSMADDRDRSDRLFNASDSDSYQ